MRARVRLSLLLLVGVLAAGAAASMIRDHQSPALLPGPRSDPPGLADLWAGRASLVLDRKWTSTSLGLPGGGGYAGAHVEVVGDTWYLFNRRTDGGTCPGRGSGTFPMATVVRSSPDRGRTWGPATPILQPTPGTPWSCAATDGDAAYDPDTDTWRYLFQCLGDAGGWHGCYAERKGSDPLGAFEGPPGANPVISPGALWGRICDDPATDECARPTGRGPVSQEGTFNIVDFDGSAWWVGFHGYDGRDGYRGMARTRSFRSDDWDVNGAHGTPTDANVDPRDATAWRESWQQDGPVGAGAASVLEEHGAFYQLVEVPDVDLACTPGQNWDLGLLRTTDLSSTSWEQFPGGNPLVYSSRAPGDQGGSQPIRCNVEYPVMFRDPDSGATYLMHGRLSNDPAYDGIYVYRVEWDRNMLRNGSLWRADAESWHPLDGTSAQLSVERSPDASPDGTPWLAFACGAAACDGQQAVYQDVPVDAGHAGATLAFGGSFRADEGEGRLQLAVLQLDAAGGVVGSAAVPVTAGAAYARARGTLELDGRTRRLRMQLLPETPGRLRGDNLYLIPQNGCDVPRYPTC